VFNLVRTVIIREPPVYEPPPLHRARLEGMQALADFVAMPEQYNRTQEFGSRKP
jgi:hypothetical protein